MDRIARALTPDVVSTLLAVAGLLAVVVGVAGSPAPWWAAVLVGAGEAFAAAWAVAWNDRARATQGQRSDLRSVA